MSTISVDRICPRHTTSTDIEALTIGNGDVLSKYERIPFQSIASGPFTDQNDNTTPMTGVITIMGDNASLFLNPYTFTPTATDPYRLRLETYIPDKYLPAIGSNKAIGNIVVCISASNPVRILPTFLEMDYDGNITFYPLYPSTDNGFSTADVNCDIYGCTISWPLSQV